MSSFDVIVIREDKDTYTCIFDGISQEMEETATLEESPEFGTTFIKKNPGIDIEYSVFFYPKKQDLNWVEVDSQVNGNYERIANWREGDKIDENRTLHFRFVDMYKGQLEEADEESESENEEEEWSDIYNECSFGEFITTEQTKHLEKYKDYTYYQTYGGGPEGGIIMNHLGDVYEVERNWGEVFKVGKKCKNAVFRNIRYRKNYEMKQVKVTK